MELLGSEQETQILLESLQNRFYEDGRTRNISKSVGANEPHQAFATPADGITWVDILAQASRQKQSFLLSQVDVNKGRAQDSNA